MSASPTTQAQSAKRPLEDDSSPSAPTDQPDAKRPATDKAVNGDEAPGTNGVETEAEKKVEDAQPQPIQSAVPSGNSSNVQQDESQWIHIRAVISSAEAATVIGKGGENVATIRQMSLAKCTVSDYQKGAVERILTVSGAVDAVAKVHGIP